MIAAGFGFRSGATIQSLLDALACANPEGRAFQRIATADDKAEAEVFQMLSTHLRIAAQGIDQATLSAQTTMTQSIAALAARGIGSLAEAAALAAAGPGARLLAARVISHDGMATCALALGTAL